MGNSVGFYCGQSDSQSFQDFALSIGLHIVPLSIENKVDADPSDGPFCFLSLVKQDELHPFGVPAVRISDARDPLIGYMRAYYKSPYLVLGHIYWSNDVPALAAQTKGYYQKLARWIRKEWEKYGDFYISPEAVKLMREGAEMVNVLPD